MCWPRSAPPPRSPRAWRRRRQPRGATPGAEYQFAGLSEAFAEGAVVCAQQETSGEPGGRIPDLGQLVYDDNGGNWNNKIDKVVVN